MSGESQRKMDDKKQLDAINHIVQQRTIHPRQAKRLADVLSQLIARRGYARVRESGELDRVWAEAVGQSIATRTRPGRTRRGVLTIVVVDSLLVQELTFRKSEIITKLNNLSPERAIRDIRFRVGAIK